MGNRKVEDCRAPLSSIRRMKMCDAMIEEISNETDQVEHYQSTK